jgi:hypothetical protein
MGTTVTKMLHGILWDKNIPKEIKENIFHGIVKVFCYMAAKGGHGLKIGGTKQPNSVI